MGDKSQIQWTDATWNPVTGCAKVSPGCAHCYAERVAIRLWPKQYRPVLNDGSGKTIDTIPTHHEDYYLENGLARPRRFTDVQCHEDRLDQPLRWRRPRKIFVNSMSDLFHESVPDAFVDKVFAVMALAPQHTFQVLTKRAERMRDYCASRFNGKVFGVSSQNRETVCWTDPLSNVWLGVSVENQRFANERIPLLLQTPAAVRFISAEPLLGPVDLHRLENPADGFHASALQRQHDDNRYEFDAPLDWVIVGGESGAGARPFDIAWGRSIVAQCQAAGVPVFVKQIGEVPVVNEAEWRATNPTRILSATKHRRAPAGTVTIHCEDRKGGDPSEWPSDLRIRQFPEHSR